MSDSIERVEEIVGVPIGQTRDPSLPFYQAIDERGLTKPHVHWVSEVRHGRTRGRQFLIKLELGITDPNDPSKKDGLYGRVATEGVSIRTYSDGEYAHRYSSDGFVENIAQNLSLEGDDVRQFLAAMRTDLVFGPNSTNDEFNNFFIIVAQEYLRANTEALFPSRRKPGLIRLNEEWDRRSPLTFYRNFYSDMGGSTKRLGGWVPYEVAIMKRFYEDRLIRGSSRPTLFDERTFKCRRVKDLMELAGEVRTETGIIIDEDVVLKHRNALVYGKANSGLFRSS